MAFRSRSQRRTKRLPEPITIEFSPEKNTFNLQIFESNLEVFTGNERKGKWKKTHVVLQSGKGVFTSLLFYKKPSKFVAKLAPLQKHDLQTEFNVSLGEVIKNNRFTIDINTQGAKGDRIRLAAESEELRSLWMHELVTKRNIDPLSSECLKWFVVRIKDTVGTNRLKLSGKCTLCVYRDRLVLATVDGVMLGEFPLQVIKSYKSADEFQLSLSSGSMYGEITLFVITNQTREVFEIIHRLKMHSMGRDVDLPTPTSTPQYARKQMPDDTAIRPPSRRPSKRNERGKLQDSVSETDLLSAVESDKPIKPPLPRIFLTGRSRSNASAFMKPLVPLQRMHSPSMYARNPDLLRDSGEFPEIKTPGRRPSEPPMSEREKMSNFPMTQNLMSSSLKTHSQFTTPDDYDHALFKPLSLIRPINEASESASVSSPSTTQYDCIQVQRPKKINIYESLSFGKSDKSNVFVQTRDPNEVPDIPITCASPPKLSREIEPDEQEDNFALSNSFSVPHNISELSDQSFSSQNPSVFSSTPPSSPFADKLSEGSSQANESQYRELFKHKGDMNLLKPTTSSLKGLHGYKRPSLNNHYETINFGFHTLGSGRRKAVRRMKLGKAKSEMPPGMLVTDQTDNDVPMADRSAGTRPSSFNLSSKKNWEVV